MGAMETIEIPPLSDELSAMKDEGNEYFRSGEDGLDDWLAELDANEGEFVLAMAQTLTWTWVEHELAAARRERHAGEGRRRVRPPPRCPEAGEGRDGEHTAGVVGRHEDGGVEPRSRGVVEEPVGLEGEGAGDGVVHGDA